MSEASKSDKVGFMRNGEVLIEGSSEEIMQKFSVKTLDQVFFSLAYHQEKRRKESFSLDEIEPVEKVQLKSRKNSNNRIFKTIAAILHKDFIQVRRHGIFLAFQTIFPVLVIILVLFYLQSRILFFFDIMYLQFLV